MTKDESKYLVRMVKSLFPNWRMDNPADTVAAWHYVLREQELGVCMSALKAYTLTDQTGFPPSPGQLLGQVTKTDVIPESDAWSMVKRAVGRSGYYAQEEWERLPAQVRAMVTPDLLHAWSLVDERDIPVLAGQFHRYYEAAQVRRAEQAVIPEATMAALTAAMASAVPALPLPEKPAETEPVEEKPRENVRQKAPISVAELMARKQAEMERRAAKNGVEELPGEEGRQ